MKHDAPRSEDQIAVNDTARDLLDWYDRHRRHLPWRAGPGETADPYRVWLSEIMLQQTTVAAVIPYFERFTAAWPTVGDLAAAPLDDVLREWQGLGYYARARNLHKCAGVVAAEHGGRFPDGESALRALPGIGPYTAAAIAAIAFGRPATPVDGNVERVVARLFRVVAPLPGGKPDIAARAATLTPAARSGDFAQAMMDLGATVCTPRAPKCVLCPLAGSCAARRAGDADSLPARAARKTKPIRHGVSFWLQRPDGAVLLRRRPPKGLLGGMMELPGTDWRDSEWSDLRARRDAPTEAAWRALPGEVNHVFTHFHLRLRVMAATIGSAEGRGPDDVWARPEDFHRQALPTVMKKVIRHAVTAGA